MEPKETRILGTTEDDIKEAAKIIIDGGLVAFPTETHSPIVLANGFRGFRHIFAQVPHCTTLLGTLY